MSKKKPSYLQSWRKFGKKNPSLPLPAPKSPMKSTASSARVISRRQMASTYIHPASKTIGA